MKSLKFCFDEEPLKVQEVQVLIKTQPNFSKNSLKLRHFGGDLGGLRFVKIIEVQELRKFEVRFC